MATSMVRMETAQKLGFCGPPSDRQPVWSIDFEDDNGEIQREVIVTDKTYQLLRSGQSVVTRLLIPTFGADVERAKKKFPSGATCQRCEKPNDHADDCGWFMGNAGYWGGAHPEFDNKYLCRECWEWSGSRTGER